MATATGAPSSVLEAKLGSGTSKVGRIGVGLFGVVVVCGFIYAADRLISDLYGTHSSGLAFVLLGIALLTALGFEFVNGFHDTANAVATVIYTHSLEPHLAVVWSGLWNFAGVLVSSGAVAFGIISLLPVELILQVGSTAGFAIVFALLVAAILWNLGTWYFGLPASSSHTLVGSIIGVGIANQLMSVKTGTSGVDWGQATNIGKSLLFSPLIGFVVAALLLLLCKALIPNKALYEAPKGTEPPPFWIRGLLVLTCTGVSFAHGSNDGQKGMGLIMLILIGTVPTAYAVNHAVTASESQDFVAVSQQTADMLSHYVTPGAVVGDSRDELLKALAQDLAKKGVRTRTEIGIANDVGMEILRITEHNHADLIVIATHGMTGWHKLAFGSVTEKVVKMAACPVLVLRAQLKSEQETPSQASRSVVTR